MLIYFSLGEGDLPPGSMAFSKLLKYQKDWDVLANSIQSRKNEVSQSEILGIKLFLKGLANEYYDMDLLLGSISEPSKAAEAKTLAKEFRTTVRACDDAATNDNLDKIIELYPKTKAQMKDFFALLQDVPDEL